MWAVLSVTPLEQDLGSGRKALGAPVGHAGSGSLVAAKRVVCGDLDENDRYPVGIR
jgi:hypothetical protein